ncbi:mechanosensitive ion channel family protein [Methanosarcina sp. Mfa9]|uniref:mechanosensitive ion channel family protein n=1 Tax=Methanosarcina sp. Mfa9 TaxID=3439063 RepID=UPI003F86B03D
MVETEVSNFLQVGFIPYFEVLVLLVFSFFFISWVKSIIKEFLSRTDIPRDIQNILSRAVVYVLWFIVIMCVVSELNLGELLKPIIGGSVIIAAAFALAVKEILADAVAGLFLLSDHQFNIGDRVETMKYRGEIINVTLRKTRIKTDEGTIVVLPNGKIDSSGWLLFDKDADGVSD